MTVKIEDRTVHIGWQALVGILVFTASTTWAISNGLHNINESVKDVRSEMHVAIDSVKNKQLIRSVQSDNHFQRIEDKLDQICKAQTK